MDNAPLKYRHDIRVRYADTDKMEIVWNGKYFEYFEVGRTELLRSLGLAYADMERAGTRLPVIETYCKYMSPAAYDDIISIETRMENEPSARLRLDYRIYNKMTQQLLAEGYTVHAFQDITTLKPVRPPKIFLDAVGRAALRP